MYSFSIGDEGYFEFDEEARSAAPDIAEKSGLSASTIEDEIYLDHLTTEGGGFSDREIRACDIIKWLEAREKRCHGLTPKSQAWLAELREIELQKTAARSKKRKKR